MSVTDGIGQTQGSLEHYLVIIIIIIIIIKPLSLTVSEIFNGECDATVDMTLNYL